MKFPEGSLIGDHPALDLLNTVQKMDGVLVDLLQSDADVLKWLERVGFPIETRIELPPQALLGATRALRDVIRATIGQRKKGEKVELLSLNGWLAKNESHLELVHGKNGRRDVILERRRLSRTAEQILAPLAEAAADLLANGDFELVRPCEDKECVLWFLDRTKSHHRRWCSMAACGNRNKVASFRERQLKRSSK